MANRSHAVSAALFFPSTAVLSGAMPNALFSLNEFGNSMLGHAFRAALDDYCYSTVVAAATDFGATGGDLLEQIRYGQAAVQENGFDPDLVIRRWPRRGCWRQTGLA